MYNIHVQWNPSIPDTLRTAYSVLIKGGVLISVVVYILVYVAGTMHGVLTKGGVLISGCVLIEGFHYTCTYMYISQLMSNSE